MRNWIITIAVTSFVVVGLFRLTSPKADAQVTDVSPPPRAAEKAAERAPTIPAADTELPRARSLNPSNSPSTTAWIISLIDERRIPAEEAGVLVAVNVKEGDEVKKFRKRLFRTEKDNKYGDEKDTPALVQIDTSLARRQQDVARREYSKAKAEADNEVPEKVATKAADVAWATWQKGVEANKRSPGSIVEVEIMRMRFEYEAAKLRIDQAAMERTIAGLTAEVKKEEYYAAQDSIERRRIDSPIDGVVTNVYIQEGEWVKPGDPVLRVINLSKLRVKGFLNFHEKSPNDVEGQPVTARVRVSGGREETFTGKVTFVHREIQSGGDYAVWADIENRKLDNGKYALQPGMEAEITFGGDPRVGRR